MSDFLQISQDIAELWPFEKYQENIPFLLIFQNDLTKTLLCKFIYEIFVATIYNGGQSMLNMSQ